MPVGTRFRSVYGASTQDEMGRARKTDNVSADFTREDLDGTLTDARDRVQPLDLVLKRAQLLGDLLTQVIDQFVQAVKVGELMGEGKRWYAPTFRRRAEYVGDPFTSTQVRPTAWHLPDVSSIDQQQREGNSPAHSKALQ